MPAPSRDARPSGRRGSTRTPVRRDDPRLTLATDSSTPGSEPDPKRKVARPYGPYPLHPGGGGQFPVRDGSRWVWARCDVELLPRLLAYRWRLVSGYPTTNVWSKREKKATHLMLHRMVMRAEAGVIIDHMKGDRLDVRRSQLRRASHSENSANRHVSRVGRSSKYRGVTRHRCGKWQAAAKSRIDGRDVCHYLGLHDSQEAAALAYDRKALALWGPFAVLNFPRLARRAA